MGACSCGEYLKSYLTSEHGDKTSTSNFSTCVGKVTSGVRSFSNAEVECQAMAHASSKMLWVHWLLYELGFTM